MYIMKTKKKVKCIDLQTVNQYIQKMRIKPFEQTSFIFQLRKFAKTSKLGNTIYYRFKFSEIGHRITIEPDNYFKIIPNQSIYIFQIHATSQKELLQKIIKYKLY